MNDQDEFVCVSTPDPVESPVHYRLFPDEEGQVIDIIGRILTEDEFSGYCKGNILKYRLRAGSKDNTLQDIDKAKVYERWLWEGRQND